MKSDRFASGSFVALLLKVAATSCGLLTIEPAIANSGADSGYPTYELRARIVAVGIQAPSGVRQVGAFHAGGPIPGNPEFLAQTRPGKVLDPERILVASEFNYGAQLANSGEAPGAVLSIDPRGPGTLVIPADVARAGAQSELTAGRVKIYTTQSPPFLNSRYNRNAVTGNEAAVSGPRYISINNGFGRPWIANSPHGPIGPGSVSVTDPDGRPLDNAPSSEAGGVFAGAITQRRKVPTGEVAGSFIKAWHYRSSGQLTPGDLRRGALGTAFLGPSPDGSGFAVFAVVTADGSVSQVHVQDGVDGLAPPGTVTPADPRAPQGVIGVAFKWNPDRALFIVDGPQNKIMVLHLADDARHFTLKSVSDLRAAELNRPVDVAPAIPEIANPRFASHTTVAGGADLYVANAGDGTLVRMNQEGKVLGRALIVVPGLRPIGAGRMRALAVSSDAQRIWITVDGPLPGYSSHPGALIEVSAFDANGPYQSVRSGPELPRLDANVVEDGRNAFLKEFSTSEGLGPLFNARSCVTCHSEPTVGGTSTKEETFVLRAGRLHPVTGRLQAFDGSDSIVVRRHSIREFGVRNAPPPGTPRAANLTSLRMPPPLYHAGLLDRIPDEAILAHAVSKGDGIRGRPNRVVTATGEEHIGRYGWKADIATLDEMVARAYANELGITSPLAPKTGRYDEAQPLDDDGGLVRAVAAFLRKLSLSVHSASR